MGKGNLRTVVFSGVNFTEGGPLSIMKDATAKFLQAYPNQFHLILLVHSKSLFSEYEHHAHVTIMEYPWVKGSYLSRLYFEWIKCRSISKSIDPHLWFALHDITPNVKADKRVVYCHNPAPFFRITLHHALMDKTFFLHNMLYKFFYRVNIKKNHFVVVQQLWMKQLFEKNYGIRNIVIAHPDIKVPEQQSIANTNKESQAFTFFYPAFPRVFKNFETLLEAAEKLSKQNASFEVCLTISGNENKYAAYLKKKYGHIAQIRFMGQQTREQVLQMMKSCDCVVFPSKLETWGLPLTEAAHLNKTILAANLLYAHETVEGYDKVGFFKPDDPLDLSEKMLDSLNGKLVFTKPVIKEEGYVYLRNWESLFAHILAG